MRLAIGDLELEGFLHRRRGSGTYANPVRSVMPQSLGLLLLEPYKAGTVGMSALINGANSYLNSIGSQLTIINRSPETWNTPLVRSLAGLLVIPAKITQSHLETLDRLGLPRIIILNSDFAGSSVRFDFKAAAKRVVNELLKLGHRKFGIISGHDEHFDRLRKEGIYEALTKAHIDVCSVPDFRTNYETEPAWEAARQLLGLRERPTAIIAFDDTLALQVIREAGKNGLQVPGDLSVTGFNDAPHALLVTPSLSTVRISLVDAGFRAAEALCLSSLRKQPITDISLPWEWVPRESTGPAPL
jgi:LacI family transcriptional regulator